MCENAFARVDRGAGRPAVARCAYFPADAKKQLGGYTAIVFVGCRVPVAMFGYEDGISQVVDYEKQTIFEVRKFPSFFPVQFHVWAGNFQETC